MRLIFIGDVIVMKIESKRLILRNWEDGDVEDIVDGLNNIEVAKWMAGVPYPYTENDAKQFIEHAKSQEIKLIHISLLLNKKTGHMLNRLTVNLVRSLLPLTLSETTAELL